MFLVELVERKTPLSTKYVVPHNIPISAEAACSRGALVKVLYLMARMKPARPNIMLLIAAVAMCFIQAANKTFASATQLIVQNPGDLALTKESAEEATPDGRTQPRALGLTKGEWTRPSHGTVIPF